MGKASRWFRGLLGLKKSETQANQSLPNAKPSKTRKWSFAKSHKEKNDENCNYHHHSQPLRPTGTPYQLDVHSAESDDPSKHAITVAAATAAVAEAAVAAAQAAAEVVRLTSSGRSISTTAMTVPTTARGGGALGQPPGFAGSRELWAAIKIQSHFRAYLARRALRALRALVKLQALVRGYIIRKHTADVLRSMQALVRAQGRARIGRSQISESPHSSTKSNQFFQPGPATPEKFEHTLRARSVKHEQLSMLRRNCSKSNRVPANPEVGCYRIVQADDERSDKILEVDTGKPYITQRRNSLFHSTHLSLYSDPNSHSFTTSKESTAHQTVPSLSSCEVQSLGPAHFCQDVEEGSFCTADNSPQCYSASSKGGNSKRGPFTPAQSDGSRSCLSGYSDYPNYMSYTESSKAKVRSYSAPRQRPQYERSSSAKRYSLHSHGEPRTNTQKVSSLHTNFTTKAYPGSGRLDRLGMPVRPDAYGYSGGHWHTH